MNEVVGAAQGFLSTVVGTACKEHGVISDAGATIAVGGIAGGPTPEVKAAVATLGIAIAGFGGALGLLHRVGAC